MLLVHGGIGSPADFNQMVSWLIADGYVPYTVDLGFPEIDIAANSEKISAKVDQIRAATGASQVYLEHSRRSLSRGRCSEPAELNRRAARRSQDSSPVEFGNSSAGHTPEGLRDTPSRAQHGWIVRTCLPLIDGGIACHRTTQCDTPENSGYCDCSV